jgi:NAD(P)-dependent dehydrogenase (short-subunit alcohol dehydrogenase family)
VDHRDWEHTLDVNVTGVYLMTKHAVPTLRESDQASIVNIASISGKEPLVYRTSYTTSKMAVVGLSRTLAFELGDDQITVNAVCPGSVDSPRMDRVIERKARELNESEAAVREDITEDAALGRMVEPNDVADIVVYLASEKGRHITGQDINVDAGTIWD